jgi:hypothetical protein
MVFMTYEEEEDTCNMKPSVLMFMTYEEEEDTCNMKPSVLMFMSSFKGINKTKKSIKKT